MFSFYNLNLNIDNGTEQLETYILPSVNTGYHRSVVPKNSRNGSDFSCDIFYEDDSHEQVASDLA